MHEAKYVLAAAATREHRKGRKKINRLGEWALRGWGEGEREIDLCEMKVRDRTTLCPSYPCPFPHTIVSIQWNGSKRVGSTGDAATEGSKCPWI